LTVAMQARDFSGQASPRDNPMKFDLHDFRGRDDPDVSEAERKPWRAEWSKIEDGAQLSLLAPDGSTRIVRVEIDRGDLRVRVYADPTVSDIPAAELILKPGDATATFEPAE